MKKFVYKVGKNESLAAVASKFSVPLSALISDNALKERTAYEGMRLLICKRAGTLHAVGPFETLAKIAEKYGADIDAIKKENALSDNAEVFIGQRVFIPNGTEQ